jgi:D-cysteine desulfhydrase family pyridoxal phosphate-dependent enzyme
MSQDAFVRIADRLQRFSRVSLIQAPTPFHELRRLSQHLSGPRIFIKREDMTGLAFGGNKSRKLEYIMPDILAQQADVIITWASVQSNWCLQTAAAARMFGLIPLLLLFKTSDLPDEMDGNLLLDFILGASIKIRPGGQGKFIGGDELEAAVAEAVSEVQERGQKPYIVPVGGSLPGWSMKIPLGALAYVDAFLEMQRQADRQVDGMDYVILASGSGGTQAGLCVAAKALGRKTKILGISVIEDAETYGAEVLAIARDTEKALGLETGVEKDDIIILDEYIREGYGILDQDVARAVRLMAETEGIFVDPVYTGKALVALQDLVRRGYFEPGDRVAFLHTGGIPALFPQKHRFSDLLSKERRHDPE